MRRMNCAACGQAIHGAADVMEQPAHQEHRRLEKRDFALNKYMIRGGRELFGEVTVSGAKNAAVAIIPAALLVDGVCRIENIPQISDVTLFFSILEELGARVRVLNRHAIEIDCHAIHSTRPSYDLARRIRASYYLLGALLGRFGQATVAMPGGCNFGVRPIDQHIKGFTTMGAEVTVEGGFIHTAAKNGRLVGAPVYLDVVSVGATMNIMMAAVLAFTMVGSFVASKVPGATMGSFSVFMTMLLGVKFIVRPVMTTKEAMQGVSAQKRLVQSLVCGMGVGFICGFIGAGGGMMMLLLLTSVLGYELKTAVGTSVFIMTFTALTGAVSHFAIGGAPDLSCLVCCVLSTLLWARIAAKFANKAEPTTLNRATGVVLVILGVAILGVKYL